MSPDKAQRIGNDLACMAKTLSELADELKAEYDLDREAEEDAPEGAPVPEVKYPDISEVRGLLADKSRAGHTDEIHALLEKHGAKKLSQVRPAEYAVLMEEARLIE